MHTGSMYRWREKENLGYPDADRSLQSQSSSLSYIQNLQQKPKKKNIKKNK